MTTYILGAGPTGLAVADGLIDARAGDFVVLEQSTNLGGLAQTVRWEGVGNHDFGPHKIFSLNKSLIHRVEALLPDSGWLTRNKVSSIFMRGQTIYFLPAANTWLGESEKSPNIKEIAFATFNEENLKRLEKFPEKDKEKELKEFKTAISDVTTTNKTKHRFIDDPKLSKI